MYQAFYKLRGKPFQLTPDPGMLFPSKGHRRAMAYLLYGFEQGEGFVVITGAVGTGKTLLIQKLFEELANRNIAVASIASANLDGEDILPAVAAALELPFDGRGKEALLQDVKRHLISLHARRTHALLVVDEAQTLTPAALEMLRILSNFEFKGRALLQVFLVGQTELRRTIVSNHMEQLRQRIIASHRLEPMSEEECREYILHRLRAVAWNNDPQIAPQVFANVFRASRGIPRKINLIMDRLLLHGYLEGLHTLDATALTVVLDEITEEMAGTPPTLEPATVPNDLDLSRSSSPLPAQRALAELDAERNKFLLQLLREEVQRRELLQPAAQPPSTNTEAAPKDARYPRSGQERQ